MIVNIRKLLSSAALATAFSFQFVATSTGDTQSPVNISVIARSDVPIDGLTFDGFNAPSLGQAGHVGFGGTIAGTAATQFALISGLPGSLNFIGRTGDSL